LRDGVTIVQDVTTYDGPMEMCHTGLHASVKALDALGYAPGPIACRVECSGDIETSNDKLICRRRRVLWMCYAARPLKLWACDCAERALLRERAAGREPDPRSWKGIEIQRAYLDGKATIEELKEAERASSAARSAASYAASSAAWAAASSAASDAAWDAARNAASYAASSAASDAAWDAARNAASSAASSAAWAAASSTASDAERDWQESALVARLCEAGDPDWQPAKGCELCPGNCPCDCDCQCHPVNHPSRNPPSPGDGLVVGPADPAPYCATCKHNSYCVHRDEACEDGSMFEPPPPALLPPEVVRVVEAAMAAWKAHQDHLAEEPECKDARIVLWKALADLPTAQATRSVRGWMYAPEYGNALFDETHPDHGQMVEVLVSWSQPAGDSK
jgi:hypothetical protein